MLGSVLAAAIYNNVSDKCASTYRFSILTVSQTTSLGNAYGVCVMFVTFFDTCMVSLAALIVWRLPIWGVAGPWLIIACLDGTYLSASLIKVPDGACEFSWSLYTKHC